MKKTHFTIAAAAVKLRAKKVGAHPDAVKQFLKLTHETGGFCYATNGNTQLWRKFGQVARGYPLGEVDTRSYTLTVKTIWKGADYTVVTTIKRDSKVVGTELSPEELVASFSVEHKWKGYSESGRSLNG